MKHSCVMRIAKTFFLAVGVVFFLSSCRLLALSLLYPYGYDGYGSGGGTTTGTRSGGGSSGGGTTTTGTSGGTSTGSTGTSSGTNTGSTGTTSGGTSGISSTLPIYGTALSWGDVLTFDRSYFASFAAGSKIIITETNTDRYSSQLKMYAPVVNSGWAPLAGGTITNATLNSDGVITSKLNYNTTGTLIYTVTQTEAENLRNYGMYLHGGGMTISSIQLSANGSASQTGTSYGTSTGSTTTTPSTTSSTGTGGVVVYSGGYDLGNWSYFLIEASKLQSVQNGTVINIFTAQSSTVPNPSSANLRLYVGNTWQALTGGSVSGARRNGDALVPNAINGTVSYVLTANEANAIKQRGLIVQGYGIRVNTVTLSGAISSSSTGSTTTVASKPNSNGNSVAAPNGSPYFRHGTLSVRGANLVDKNGKKVQLYGMSTHGLSWYPQYVCYDSFKTLRDDWNTNCVRLVLYPRDYNGYLTGGDQNQLKQTVYNGIDYATNLGMYVIVDWHVHNYNPNETVNEAIAFFRDVSARYKSYDNILYEICNEPINSDWNNAIKPYAEKVIPAIRANDSNAVVLVGTNTWSQDLEGPLSNRLSYTNVMYTFHFYANTHTDIMRGRLQAAVNAGLPVFISEFGTCDASGNGGFNLAQSTQWFSVIQNYNLSHINWSLCNKSETASALLAWTGKTSGWQENELSESGRLVREHFRTLSN